MSLIRAVRNRDVAHVRSLLESPSEKRSINDLDETGLAPVHYAARAGDVDIVTVLHEAGADLKLEVRGDSKAPPLHLAAASGSLPMIDFLLDNGVEVDRLARFFWIFNGAKLFESYVLALMVAASERQYRAALHLLGRRANPNAPYPNDSHDRTVLHFCLLGDRYNDPDTADPDLLALMSAALENGVDLDALMPVIADSSDPSFDCWYWSAIHLAAIFNKPLLIDFLAEAGADVDVREMESQITPIHCAAEYGYLKAFQSLQKAGADVFALTQFNYSVLHTRHEDRLREFTQERLKIFELAIEAGVDINIQVRPFGCTPLIKSAWIGATAAVRFFIDRSADLNIQSFWQGYTASHYAALHGYPEVLQMLIAAGSDLKARCAKPHSGTVLEVTERAHAKDGSGESPEEKEERLIGFEKIMSILVAAGERQWALIPTPCRCLERALPAVLEEAPEDLGELYKRLMPGVQGEIRSALLLLNRFCSGSARDLRLPMLEALVGIDDT